MKLVDTEGNAGETLKNAYSAYKKRNTLALSKGDGAAAAIANHEAVLHHCAFEATIDLMTSLVSSLAASCPLAPEHPLVPLSTAL